jgi:hypothetical protein
MSLGSPCEGSLAPRDWTSGPAATSQNSIRFVARYAALAPLVAGAVLLIAGEFITAREIRALTVVPPGGTETGGALHGYALGVIGLAILVMSFGAVLRGARPAAVAVLALSLAACVILAFVDRPLLDDTGLIGQTYDLAEARPAAGFYLQSMGAVLALIGAVGAMTLSGRRLSRR